jgi:protein phosphatase
MAKPSSSERSLLLVSASAVTDAGCVRALNEDCCHVVHPSDSQVLGDKGVLIVIADGMGGYQAGEVASRLAVETITRAYYATVAEPSHALGYAFQEANNQIHSLSLHRHEFSGMGTTCSALVIRGRLAHTAHVGDSRIYLVRSNSIYQMTEDHSLVRELVRSGALAPDAARRHPNRNLILKALGTRQSVDVMTWNEPLPLRPGDCFVLCSDGLHDIVADDEIRLATQSGGAAAACESLVAKARSRGGHDNITVAIARIEG